MDIKIKKENTSVENNNGDMRLVWMAAAFFIVAIGIGIYLFVRARNGAWEEAQLKAQQIGQEESNEDEEVEETEEEASPDLAAALDEINASGSNSESEDNEWSDDSSGTQSFPEPPSRSDLKSVPTPNTTPQNIQKEGPFAFTVVADSEAYSGNGYNPELADVLSATSAQKGDFTILTGDIIAATGDSTVNRQRIGAAKSLIERYAPRFYVAFGKHDLECGEPCVDLWSELLFNKKYAEGEKRVLYYSFNYGNTHFVLLSSDYPSKHAIDDDQLAWLDKDLEANKKENTIAVVHVPPVTFFKESAKECHDMSCNAVQQRRLLEILKKYNVDLVISGHEHTFDHQIVDNIDYVLAGNTGNSPRYDDALKGNIYSLITVNNASITLKATELSGKTIREIQIK